MAIELGVLVLVVARPPRVLLLPRRRQVLAGAAAAAALSVAITVATLPVRAIARERAKDVGLVTQDWAGYAGDVAQEHGDRRRAGGRGRRAADLRHAPLRPPLVGAGGRRGDRLRRRDRPT